MTIKIDRCLIDGSSGCVEACYPYPQWKMVDCISTYLEPSEQEKQSAQKKGATVFAYGGDSAWFAMKPKGAE